MPVSEPVAQRQWYDFGLGQAFTVGRGGNHDGRDIQTPLHTPLTNILGGTVTSHTGWYPWGGEVDILTPSGITETWAHLDALAVKPGQVVAPGQFIGLSGGDNLPRKYSTGPHTHFSLFRGKPWDNSQAIDPTGLLDWAQDFLGDGPSVPDPITGGLAGSTLGNGINAATGQQTVPAGQTLGQVGSSIVNVTVNSALDSVVKGLGFNKMSDFLWGLGLVLLGGTLVVGGLLVFILPGAEKAVGTTIGAAVRS